ncbi:hypothetical protein RB195_023094 [Necator americanus]|uniref:Uncharacterized protein n=1 Tax=Necator americanus TaxID=51031 RepID=A0ABR1EHX2_NECAM
MCGSETSAASSTVMGKFDYMERKILRRLLGHFRLMVCHNEEHYSELDMVPADDVDINKRQHLARASEEVTENRLRFFGHVIRIPFDHLVQVVLKMLSDSNLKRPPDRKRRYWMEVVKKDLSTLGVDR